MAKIDRKVKFFKAFRHWNAITWVDTEDRLFKQKQRYFLGKPGKFRHLFRNYFGLREIINAKKTQLKVDREVVKVRKNCYAKTNSSFYLWKFFKYFQSRTYRYFWNYAKTKIAQFI